MEQFSTALLFAAIFGLFGMDLHLAGLLDGRFTCGIEVVSMFGP